MTNWEELRSAIEEARQEISASHDRFEKKLNDVEADIKREIAEIKSEVKNATPPRQG